MRRVRLAALPRGATFTPAPGLATYELGDVHYDPAMHQDMAQARKLGPQPDAGFSRSFAAEMQVWTDAP